MHWRWGAKRERVSMEGHWGYAALATLAGNVLKQDMADIFLGLLR